MTTVGTITGSLLVALETAELGPGDVSLAETWNICHSITNLAGSRLLERKLGSNLQAAGEVQAFLWHFERVGQVCKDAPVMIPAGALRPLQQLGILVERTKDPKHVVEFLLGTPELGAAFSAYADRSLGLRARPITDVLELFVAAGAVFRTGLRRATPYAELNPKEV